VQNCTCDLRAKTDPAQLRRLLDQLEAGDVVTVTRIDRPARSTFDRERISLVKNRMREICTSGSVSRAKAQEQQMGRPPATYSGTADGGHPAPRAGATLDELARSYNFSISTIRRATCAA
jgi:hypothetical protein